MRAVLFDVDGVLVRSRFHPDPDERHYWDANLLEDLGVVPEDFQRFFDSEFTKVIRGQTALLDRLDAFLPTIGYQGSSLSFAEYWYKNDACLNNDLMLAIRKLGQTERATLYLATNQEHLRASYLWSSLGLQEIFNDMFYAARIGAAKPEMAYFDAVTDLLGAQETPPLFFDDSKAIVDAANDYGWEAIHYTTLEDFSAHPWIAQQLAR